MSLLKQNTIKKKQRKNTQLKLEASNSKEFKFATILDSMVYAKETKNHSSGLYFLVL